ncbi:MAG: hypothetical protein KDE27_11560 [Planctomycetes bacterium]|nr:hypothetical protein [Planctomycetota bacterium]
MSEAAERIAAAAARLPSDDRATVEAAYRELLALMARDPAARPFAAAGFDRLRQLDGLPQKFGTQHVERDGRRELWPVDPATTDSERAKWGLPGLAELARRGACGG